MKADVCWLPPPARIPLVDLLVTDLKKQSNFDLAARLQPRSRPDAVVEFVKHDFMDPAMARRLAAFCPRHRQNCRAVLPAHRFLVNPHPRAPTNQEAMHCFERKACPGPVIDKDRAPIRHARWGRLNWSTPSVSSRRLGPKNHAEFHGQNFARCRSVRSRQARQEDGQGLSKWEKRQGGEARGPGRNYQAPGRSRRPPESCPCSTNPLSCLHDKVVAMLTCSDAGA